ncbi:hypothetical protein A8L34_22340 [Bacillus sp. FJAT-27264]|uniref:tyrosine-type recombinase/integrase n=1 Tax=Paenibacillus sp. (strain DSM 101736 / FJAT-27264) TaxID=1850362 RepID=UPI000807D446|nr:site-specific integrase [Bacillus sp. FJAT-27264]OBZ08895.1 hypothetical protein A8L34_22340 [Bacillus sp. FJAT-27264]
MRKKKETKELPKNVRERDGKYTYRYYAPTTVVENGTEKRSLKEMESPRFSTVDEAVDFGILIQARKIQKKLRYEDNIIVRTWGDYWITEYEVESEPSERTLVLRKISLKKIYEVFGAFALRDVTAAQYQHFLNSLKRAGYSKSTITGCHSVAKMMFRYAVRQQILKEDPTALAKIPADKKPALGVRRKEMPKFLEKDELKLFLETARFMLPVCLWGYFMLLAYTGLRPAEAAGLLWSDIDTRRRTVDVNKQLRAKRIKEYYFIPPKNDQSYRTVSYGEGLAKVLSTVKAWQLEHGHDNPQHNFVFWGVENPGYPVVLTGIGEIMKRVLRKTQLSDSLTPHSLRHTHVSLLASNPRVGLPEIQARIGHKANSEITELIYLHVTKQRQMEIADDFEWAINQ